ncbi:MAG TPA: DUF6677 family protein [Acidobacteriota bacterium]|nr:DUF6677 family protein [Acidobacteriota bacterium]
MAKTALACTVGWLVPGGGHFLLGKWGRGALFLGVVLFLFLMGLQMHGELFGWEAGFFGFLKFFADAAIGVPYLLGRMLEWGAGDIQQYSYEYGNTYLYTAGLLNMLIIVDAFDIAQGRKP